jgi:hypothetical protein
VAPGVCTPAMGAPTERTPAAYIPAPPIVYGARDISGLRSGSRNPWGSLSRRRSHINPPRNLSSLHSSTSNSWRSSNHRGQHSYMTHPHRTYSGQGQRKPFSKLPPSYHSVLTPPHQFNSQFRSQHPQNSFTSYSHSYPPRAEPPANIFQIIRHPIGISETKPKITKNIPAYPTPTAITQDYNRVLHCTCGTVLPVREPDQGYWRFQNPRWRFRKGFHRRFRRRPPHW